MLKFLCTAATFPGSPDTWIICNKINYVRRILTTKDEQEDRKSVRSTKQFKLYLRLGKHLTRLNGGDKNRYMHLLLQKSKKGEKKKLLQLNFIDANQNYLNALDVIAVIIQSLLHSVFMMERSNPNYQVHITLLKVIKVKFLKKIVKTQEYRKSR